MTVIWLAFAATVWIAWWSAPRGFDFLDTGCYFLEYKYPDDVADTHTTYRLFARPFYLLVGESITGFRLVSWALVWTAAGVFAWGWLRHVQALYGRNPVVISTSVALCVFLLASATNYTIKPAALTYNSLNFVGVCIALGLFFDGTARLMRGSEKGDGLAVSEVAAAGLAATIDLLIKPTTAAFVLAVIVVYCVVSPGLSLSAKKKLGLVAVVSGICGLIAMIAVVGGIGPLMVRIGTLTSILKNPAFMGELNTRTLREFGEIGAFLVHDLRYVGPFLGIAAIVLAAMRARPVLQRKTAAVAGFVVGLLWLYSTVEGKLWRGSHGLYFEGIVARLYLGALLLTTAAAVISMLVVRAKPTEAPVRRPLFLKALLWLILVVTPFAGAYGSTTSVYLNGALYAVCWLGASLLACWELTRIWETPAVLPAFTWPMAIYAVAQLFHGQITMPYMYPVPLWQHTVPTDVAGSTLLLDAPTSEAIKTSREILNRHGFKQGDDIFCFFNVPGLVYAVGGRSPIIPWYFGRIYVGNGVEEVHMQAAGPQRRAEAWIITQAEVTQFRDHFVRGGINFPDDYDEIGTLKNPQSGLDLKIWKRRNGAL